MSTPERLAGARALLRFLARQGRLGAEDVARIEAALADGGSVHELLEHEGLITQKDLALLLAETLRLRIVDLTTYPLDANVTRELKENVATRYEVVPISIDARTIEVVTANPLDLDGLKAVEFATGKRVQAVVATHVEVKDALAHTYRLQESLEQFLQLVPAGEALVVNELSDEGDDLRTIAADAELPPVIKLADKMLIEGIKSRASDIHVEPEGDSVLVRYRVDGILEEAFRFPKWIQNPLVARLKVMAKLDITERRLPQDGRIQVRYLDKTVDMRVSSLPAQHGEKITLRILDASQAVKALDRLGFAPGDLKLMRDAAKKPQGMILITGPTGSGKTTTLYALLREIFSPKTNIVTIENPIEYQLKGINQVEVNEKQGLTFGGVLRSVLRQDPDVILLGEIRDKETAQIAFQAASTGHLVLSTVHTNDAAGAVTRLMDLGLEPYAIASALNLVVAQRLVRQLCPTCAKPGQVDPETRRQLHLDDEVQVKEPAGCGQCRHQGYRSRLGVYELLPMTSAITKLIEAGAGESMVRQQARAEGAHSMLEDAVEKVRTGTTSVEELHRVIQINDGGGAQCPGCQKEIAEDYAVCPHCSKVLRASCSGCAKPLNPEWVRCPYCGSTAVAEETPAADAVGPTATSRRSFKALVVDDTATIRDVVRHTLEHSDLGLAVLTAEDGPQALELAGRERPDIVILDISMPGMDGFEVCRRLRSEMRTAFVPVLMLTAHDSEDDVAKGFGVGADDYMVKPFRREGLLARVRRILERTYGSQAIGAPPFPDTTGGVETMASVEAVAAAAGPSDEVVATVAALAADREALRSAIADNDARVAASDARITTYDARIAANDARMGELVARLDEMAVTLRVVADRVAGLEARPTASVTSAVPEVDDLRAVLARMLESQERGFAELRAEAARATATAEDALASARAATGALPSIDLASMMSTLEQLRGEHASLASVVQAAAMGQDGVDEECERRLRQVAVEIEELRAVTATMETALQGETLAATERMARELAAVQRELAEHAARRDDDAARVAATDATAQAVRGEIDAAVRRFQDQFAALERGMAGQGSADAMLAAQVASMTERMDAVAERSESIGARVEALGDEARRALESLRDETRATLASVHDETHATVADVRDELAAAARRFQEQVAALADGVAGHGSADAMFTARVASMAERMDTVAERTESIGARVDALADETRGALENLRDETRTALAGVRDETHAAIATVRAETHTGLAAVREEALAVSDAVRDEVRTLVAGYQDEARAMVAEARDEMRVSAAALRDDVVGVRTEAVRIATDVDAVRRTVESERDDVTVLGEALRRSDETLAVLRETVTSAAERAAAEYEDVRRRGATHDDVERTVAALREDFERRMSAAAAASDVAERNAVAAAEAVARAAQVEALSAATRATDGLAELRDTVFAQQGVQQEQLVWLQGRIGQARRAAVKLVRRVRVAGRAADARVEAREVECDRRLTALRDETVAAVERLRLDYATTAERLASVDVADAAVRDETARRLGAELLELKTVVERLDGDHRRHAADVEERLRNVMRTAAGGFDVQIALLRGKVEVLAKTLREQVPLDPDGRADEALLQHRHGLMDLLREQLAVLQGGSDWRPQRVIDLLVETSLAAAISPFRRLLQLAQWDSPDRPAVDDATASGVTDESTSPS